MEEIAETFDILTVEQLRAMADPLRIRIYDALVNKPMTATQVGEELDEPAPKAHYHVRELERVGLVRLVETRERSGILEKYYRAIARNLRVPATFFQQASPDEVAEAVNGMFNSIVAGFKTAMSRLIESKVANFDASMLTFGNDVIWMTEDEFRTTLQSLQELLKPYLERRGLEGEHEINMSIISYDSRLARHENSEAGDLISPVSPTPPSVPRAPTPPRPPSAPSAALRSGQAVASSGRVRKVVIAGAVSYSRRELQDIADRGEQLDLNVIGYIAIANDVPADLARRVFHRVQYRGVLSAPADVREVLRTKEV